MADIIGNIFPDIQIAINIGKNIERELRHYGKTLELFEMTPSGEASLIWFEEDWVMRPKPDNKNFPEFPFEFEIAETDELADIMPKASVATISDGTTTSKFKLNPPQSPEFGFWKFRGQAI